MKNYKFERPKFDKEMNELLPKWRATNLLNGMSDYQAEQMALILENQKLIQEINDPKRDMVPLVHHIFKSFIGFDLVSVQAMMGPASDAYLMQYGLEDNVIELKPTAVPMSATTRSMTLEQGVTNRRASQQWCLVARLRSLPLHHCSLRAAAWRARADCLRVGWQCSLQTRPAHRQVGFYLAA